MARAKKTDRSEARRRARSLAAETVVAEDDADDAVADSGTRPAAEREADARPAWTRLVGGRLAGGRPAETRPAARPAASAAARTAAGQPQRIGVLGGLKAAYRPLNLRADLRLLPALVTKTHAIWLPIVLVIASTVWFRSSGDTTGRGLPALAFGLFVVPPPVAGAFMAGILTQRMSYLAGLIVGIVTGLVFVVHLAAGGDIPGYVTTQDLRIQYIPYALVFSPIAGLSIGAFAGYYRRFLALVSPPKQQQQRGRATKPGQRGRTNASTRPSSNTKPAAAKPGATAKPSPTTKPNARS